MKTLLLSAAAAALLASAPAAFAQDQDQEHHEHDRGAQPQAQHQPQGQPHAQAPGQPVGGQPNARAGAGIPAPNNPGWRRGSSPGQAGPQGGQGAPGGQNQFRPDNRGGQNPNPGGGRPDYQNHEGRDHGGPNGGGFDQNRGDRNGPGFDQNRGDRNGRNFDQGNRNYGQGGRNFDRNGGRQFNRGDFGRNVQAQRRFRAQPYRRPPGFFYRRWNYGQILPYAFFAQQYWLDSYWAYGLPAPPPGCEWVRYGDDAVLVDLDSGEVLQVYYGVFY